jgi:ferritin-like metal-binding protein YciE
MTKDQTELMLSWLNDAHAMELSLVKNLEGKAKDAEKAEKIEIKDRIEKHIEETKKHAELVEGAIKRLGGDTSITKDAMGKTMGFFQGAMNSMHDDVLVKNALESYAAENLEIAAYTSIEAGARELGDEETADMCLEIIEDEENMAEWLLEQIPEATTECLMMEKEEG